MMNFFPVALSISPWGGRREIGGGRAVSFLYPLSIRTFDLIANTPLIRIVPCLIIFNIYFRSLAVRQVMNESSVYLGF